MIRPFSEHYYTLAAFFAGAMQLDFDAPETGTHTQEILQRNRTAIMKVILVSQARAVERWKQRARQLKFETYVLYLAYKDPRVPWYAKVFTAA